MAGGTQMAAVLSIVKGMEPAALRNVCLGTTRWILNDKSSDLRGLVRQIGNVPILGANLDFSRSRFDGLRIYETGLVKEGVGAGGSTIAAICHSEGRIDAAAMMQEIDRNYERLITHVKK
jgi:NaMN:DMB phosphoribosyltransferase